MNARRFVVCFVLALTALAVATVITTDNAAGDGRAVNGDGQFADFAFNVTKVSHNDRTEKRGTFKFAKLGTEHRAWRLTLRSLSTLTVTENVATFGGPGTLRIEGHGAAHEYHGAIAVTATSNRHRGEDGAPDEIVVRFLPAVNTDPSFGFDGNLTRGDIAVTTTKSY